MKKVSCIVLVLALAAYARVDDIAKLEATHFGKTILSTVAVQLSVTEGRVDEVVEVLTELKGSIQRDQDAHDVRHANDQAEFQKQIDKYTEIINKAQQDHDDAVSAINEFTPKRDQAEKDLDAEKQLLKKLEKDLEDELADRKRKHEAHLKRQEEFDASIATTVTALELLLKLNTSEANFLQMPVLVQIVKDLPTMRNVAPSYAALLRVLVQLSTSKHASSETVNKALALIEKLKSNLETSKQNDLDDEKVALEAHEAYTKSLRESITTSSQRVTELDIQYNDYKQKVEENTRKRDENAKIVKDNTELKEDVEEQKRVEQQDYENETARR